MSDPLVRKIGRVPSPRGSGVILFQNIPSAGSLVANVAKHHTLLTKDGLPVTGSHTCVIIPLASLCWATWPADGTNPPTLTAQDAFRCVIYPLVLANGSLATLAVGPSPITPNCPHTPLNNNCARYFVDFDWSFVVPEAGSYDVAFSIYAYDSDGLDKIIVVVGPLLGTTAGTQSGHVHGTGFGFAVGDLLQPYGFRALLTTRGSNSEAAESTLDITNLVIATGP